MEALNQWGVLASGVIIGAILWSITRDIWDGYRKRIAPPHYDTKPEGWTDFLMDMASQRSRLSIIESELRSIRFLVEDLAGEIRPGGQNDRSQKRQEGVTASEAEHGETGDQKDVG